MRTSLFLNVVTKSARSQSILKVMTNSQEENWWNDTDWVNPSPRGNLSTANLHGLAQTPARAAGDFVLKTEVCLMMYKN